MSEYYLMPGKKPRLSEELGVKELTQKGHLEGPPDSKEEPAYWPRCSHCQGELPGYQTFPILHSSER